GELDALLDQAWGKLGVLTGTGPADTFSAALAHYRQVRAQMLQFARQENFEAIRHWVPEQVRPAYDRVKQTLGALGGSTGRDVPATTAAAPQRGPTLALPPSDRAALPG
ncbi:hypothetical protein ACFO3A_15370, partial [Comamonas nitrativorans]